MTRLKLVLLIGIGAVTSVPVVFIIGVVWGVWRAGTEPRPETVIRYVHRADPAASTPSTPPRARQSDR